MLYFFMFIIFLCLIVGPIVASKFLKGLPKLPLDLMQPTGINNNDTSNQITGSALNGLGTTGGAAATTGGGAAATTATTSA